MAARSLGLIKPAAPLARPDQARGTSRLTEASHGIEVRESGPRSPSSVSCVPGCTGFPDPCRRPGGRPGSRCVRQRNPERRLWRRQPRARRRGRARPRATGLPKTLRRGTYVTSRGTLGRNVSGPVIVEGRWGRGPWYDSLQQTRRRAPIASVTSSTDQGSSICESLYPTATTWSRRPGSTRERPRLILETAESDSETWGPRSLTPKHVKANSCQLCDIAVHSRFPGASLRPLCEWDSVSHTARSQEGGQRREARAKPEAGQGSERSRRPDSNRGPLHCK
jgi:hypothetical protein